MDSKHCCDPDLLGGRKMMCSDRKSGPNRGRGSDAKMHVENILILNGRRGIDLC